MDGSLLNGQDGTASGKQEMSAPRRPSLLPAFDFDEHLSSSPALPRPQKRKFADHLDSSLRYPTPQPTSSTGLLPSSPFSRRTRAGIARQVSTLSERAPLGAVPSLDIPASGEPILMGRSSNSSDYQLSSNRLISRVHVSAFYRAPSEVSPNGEVMVECLGWNGIKVHCRGEIVELGKGEQFVSVRRDEAILVDVQDTRVLLEWPKEGARLSADGTEESVEEGTPFDEESPSKRRNVSQLFMSSPPPMLGRRRQSPVSPTPVIQTHSTFSSTFRADDQDDGAVLVYEDHSSEEEDAPSSQTPVPVSGVSSKPSVTGSNSASLKESHASASSDLEELSEHDEENDPIVHSFGPYGDNILERFGSFKPTSPDRSRRSPLKSSFGSPTRNGSAARVPIFNDSPIKNHVINQLAYSRVHSIPLSTIHSNLPAELRGAMAKPSDTENQQLLSTAQLKTLLDGIPCVGEISREGKDAAGKLLESEFYYLPELDADEMRQMAVSQSLGKTGLRAARKTHKQYYWKKPRV